MITANASPAANRRYVEIEFSSDEQITTVLLTAEETLTLMEQLADAVSKVRPQL